MEEARRRLVKVRLKKGTLHHSRSAAWLDDGVHAAGATARHHRAAPRARCSNVSA